MESIPKMSRDEYILQMRQEMEELLGQVADAINEAPAGHVISDSEEKVRDLFAELRQRAYEKGLQMRVNAAEAAFSPSEGPPDRQSQTQYGTSGFHGADDQRASPAPAAAVVLAAGRDHNADGPVAGAG